jgi:acyl-CoA thioester hydrolase
MALTSFRVKHTVEVRFRDVDAMKVVNNAVYFTYLEQARLAYWRAAVGDFKLDDLQVILAHAECDYRSPATLGDQLEVRIRVSSIGHASFTCDYEIVDLRDERLVATARTVQVMYDYGAGKVIPVPDAIRARFEQIEGRRPGRAGAG